MCHLAKADAAEPELAIDRFGSPAALASGIGAHLVFGFARCFDDQRNLALIEHELATLVGQRVYGVALARHQTSISDSP